MHANPVTTAPTRAEVMAEAMFGFYAEKGSCLDSDLLAEGFTRDEVWNADLTAEARRLANQRRVRSLECDPVEARPGRLARALLIAQAVDTRFETELHRALRMADYSNTEIADLLDDILSGLGRVPAPVNLGAAVAVRRQAVL